MGCNVVHFCFCYGFTRLVTLTSRWLSLILLVLSGCRGQNQGLLDDLSALKKEFIAEVLQGSIEECPFDLSYHFRTVFYSKQLVSLFGEFHSYTHLPHGWTKYEGRTFYKNNGRFVPLLLSHLISTKENWEFIRKYCETLLSETIHSKCFIASWDENSLERSLNNLIVAR